MGLQSCVLIPNREFHTFTHILCICIILYYIILYCIAFLINFLLTYTYPRSFRMEGYPSGSVVAFAPDAGKELTLSYIYHSLRLFHHSKENSSLNHLLIVDCYCSTVIYYLLLSLRLSFKNHYTIHHQYHHASASLRLSIPSQKRRQTHIPLL